MSKMCWDEYFLKVCDVVASNSKCLSRKIGSIVVKDKSIISTGYNGPPRGVPSCSERFCRDIKYASELIRLEKNGSDLTKCPRQILGFKSGEGLEWCPAGHSERNSLINAARHGIKMKGSIMYMNCNIPCSPCLIEIINAGIKEIVVTKLEYYDIMGEYLIKESGLKVREYE